MVEFRVEIDEEEIEPNLYDVTIEDTANPFGNYAVVYVKDQEGERYVEYSRGTRVDIDWKEFGEGDSEYETRFTGFVVERREYEDQGADILEVECYTFDQFLRGTKVSDHTDGLTIFEALEQIIVDDTPISWNPNNVSVGDPQTLTRDFRGDSVEDVLLEIAHKSDNEEFGVDDDLDFFFRPREGESAPRGIDNTEWFHADIPEEGKESVNEVTVFFDGGDESVTVDDGSEKLDQQSKLGLAEPSSNRLEKTFEDITDLDDAKDKAEQILNERQAAETGEITTFGLLDARPGQVIDITIDSKDIDDEFVIAGLRYEGSTDETVVTIIRKTGYQDDVIVRVVDSVEKVELRPADRDGVENRVTEIDIGAVIDVQALTDIEDFDQIRLTNVARNRIRDGWVGDGNLTITEIAIGTDSSNLSRTNTDLENEIERGSAIEAFDGDSVVAYAYEPVEDDILEAGLFDDNGDMILRATNESGLDPSFIEFQFSIGNSDGGYGKLIDAIESIRDIIADNDPVLPTQYAYGSGDTLPDEEDLELEDEVIVLDLEEILITTVSENEEWEDAL